MAKRASSGEKRREKASQDDLGKRKLERVRCDSGSEEGKQEMEEWWKRWRREAVATVANTTDTRLRSRRTFRSIFGFAFRSKWRGGDAATWMQRLERREVIWADFRKRPNYGP